MREALVRSFAHAALSPDADVAMAALLIARIEYPTLDVRPYLTQLDTFGREASVRVGSAAATPKPSRSTRIDAERQAQIVALNRFVFDDLKFAGNATHYQDPRN